jgi:flagella synthesis protein FlgN
MADPKVLCLHKLDIQAKQLEQLHEVLEQELSSLASRSGDGLKDLARTKLTLINAIQRIDKEISMFGADVLQETDVISSVAQIRKQLEQCQQKNEVNAQAARQAHLSVQHIKEILIGSPASITYDQGGAMKTSESNLVRNLKA